MRRSTAAAVGTVASAALIMGVRLSATGVPGATAPSAVEQPIAPPSKEAASAGRPSPSSSPSGDGQQSGQRSGDAAPSASPTKRGRTGNALKDGKFSGAPASNPYGVVQVNITVADGKVTAANASYPTTGQSASINAGAIPKLKAATLQAQSAKIDTVSGATFTSEAYTTSLQAALDAARG